VSGFHTRIDNFWKNVYPRGGGSTNLGGASLARCCENEGGGETLAGRAQLKLEPSDRLTVRLTASGARQRLSTAPYTSVNSIAVFDAQGRLVNAQLASPTETRQAIGPNGENVPLPFAVGATSGNGTRLPGANLAGFNPPDPEDLELSSDFALGRLNKTDSWTAAAHIDYEIGSVNVASITSYQNYTKQFMMDTDGSPINALLFGTRAKTQAWSQELRVSGGDEAFRWQGGLYYLDIDANAVQGLLAPRGSYYAPLFGSTVDTGIDFVDRVRLKTRSGSIFGQFSYEFAPTLTLVAGGRLIREHQTYDFQQVAALNSSDYTTDDAVVLFPLTAPFADRRTKTLWAGKIQLEYRPQTGLLMYAGVNRGVKGGSYNAPLPSGGPPLADNLYAYKPETLYNYEAGLKYSSRGFNFNASTFYYDYQDYQAFVFENISGTVTNVNAKTYGADVDVGVVLAPGLRATLGGSYTHGRIKNYEIAPGVLRTVRPTYAPQYQGDVSLNYKAPWTIAGGDISANANVNYSSGFYYLIKNFDSTWYKGRTLVNLSLNWTQGDRGFQATIFAKNLMDKRYGLIGFQGAENGGSDIKSYGMPRSIGGRLAYRF
jgi:iron complex outermembrane recepter protein